MSFQSSRPTRTATLRQVIVSAGVLSLTVTSCSTRSTDGDDLQSQRSVSRALTQSQIVQGREVAAGEFPGAAAIYRNGRFSCTGTLVHPEWVVTAAHCNPNILTTTVGLGENREDHVQLAVSETHLHPEHDAARQDVALVKLATPATVAPTPIVAANFEATGQMATAWGFGRTGLNAPGSEQLLAVERAVPSPSDCLTQLGAPTQFNETMLCQFASAFGASTCTGDSGGPLTVTPSSRLLVGVVQGGDNGRCGESLNGSVNFYTALAHPTNHSFLTEHLPAEAFDSGGVVDAPDASMPPVDESEAPLPAPDAGAPADAVADPNDAGNSPNQPGPEVPSPGPTPTSSSAPVLPAPTPVASKTPVTPVSSAEPVPAAPAMTSAASNGSGCSLPSATGSTPLPLPLGLIFLGVALARLRRR